VAGLDQPADQRQVAGGVPQAPGADGKQDAGAYVRAPRRERGRGLLLEDELKTNVATLIQDAFRGLVATLFYLAASVKHDVAIYGREHCSGEHPKIVLSNHKRDFDSLVLGGVVYFARGIRHPNRRIVFCLREDAFWPGFLDAYLGWRPLRRLLSWLTVRATLHLLKTYPMGYVTSRSDMPRIEGQLRRFASLLDHGRDLYWTPEGGLSLEGHLDRFRAGFYRVVKASHAPLRILPAAIFYDFMTTLRTRCFIRFGPELPLDRSLGKVQLEEQARRAIICQMTINAGHLAVAVLRHLAPGTLITRHELESRLLTEGHRLRQAGLALDPRLTMRWTFRARVGQLLRYARREGILEQAGGNVWKVAAGMQHREMQYVLNELADAEAMLGL
jgi:1-acyl-sn-glycerol-3-phosphate acyltransferase